MLDFLRELELFDPNGFAKWVYVKQQIEVNGTDNIGKLWTRLPRGLGEIRWRAARKRLRIYCSEESQRRIVMLHAVEKKWARFEGKDQRLSEDRREDFQSDGYDQETRHIKYLQRNRGAP